MRMPSIFGRCHSLTAEIFRAVVAHTPMEDYWPMPGQCEPTARSRKHVLAASATLAKTTRSEL